MKKKSLCIVFFLFLCISVYSQQRSTSFLEIKTSITIKNEDVKTVLKQLENLTEIKFGYTKNVINLKRRVSGDFKDKSLRVILKSLFPEKRFYQSKNKILILNKKGRKLTVSGYVKEKGSLESLLGVTISVNNEAVGTYTNNYGFFSISLPPGNHSFKISSIGYKTLVKEFNLKESILYNPLLEVQSEEIDEVVITATKTFRESKKTQMGVSQFSPKIIQELPSLVGEPDALKVLQATPGIQGDEATSNLYVRGGTADQNLILLDEAPLYNTTHMFGLFSIFNGDALKSVTAYKGAFPSQFGGRLSSVIDFRTKDGNKQEYHGKFNIGLISSSINLEGPIVKDKTSFYFSGRRSYLDLIVNSITKAQNIEGGFGYYLGDLNFKIHHIINSKNKIYWSNYYSKDKLTLRDEGEGLDKSTFYYAWQNYVSTIRWNHQINSRVFTNTTFIYSKYFLELKDDYEYNKFSYKSRVDDYGVKTDINYHLSNEHEIKAGLSNTYHHFIPNTLDGETEEKRLYLKQELKSLEGGLYVEDMWKISTNVTANIGFRYSYYFFKSKTFYNQLEPRLNLAWSIKDDLMIKSSYTKMSQYTHMLYSPGRILDNQIWVMSTDRLKPQISNQFAIGAVKDFGRTGYSLGIESYIKNSKDVISFKEGKDFESTLESSQIEDNLTTGNNEAKGVEILFRKQKGKLTGWLAYSFTENFLKFDQINNGNKFVPRHNKLHDFSAIAVYKPNKRHTLSANLSYTSGFYRTVMSHVGINPQGGFAISQPSGFTTEGTASNDDGTFGDQSGSLSPATTERNNFQGQSTIRLDLSVQIHKKINKKIDRTWSISAYNSLARKNPFAYSGNGQSITKYSSFTILPTVNLTYKF